MSESRIVCIWRIECGPGLRCYEAVPEEESREVEEHELSVRRVLSIRTTSKRTADIETDLALDAILFQSWEMAHATAFIEARLPMPPHRWASEP